MKVVVTQSNAIKKKLMAATSMLLVAVIMLVSSTYAWFTLSTAPEVTGITTTVGANGNLEMALAYTDDTRNTWTTDDPGTTVGASVDALATNKWTANSSWGNLVDVSDTTQYGLDKIALLPSRLNLTGDAASGYTVGASMLKTPSYGTDGRVASLESKSTTGTYNSSSEGFVVDEDNMGVRAVGVASALTDRQLAYRNAVATITSNKTAARNTTRNSLITNGTELASVIMKHATADGDSDRYTLEDVAVMQTVVGDLQTAVGYIETAWEASLIGLATSALSEGLGIDETAALAVRDAIEAHTADAPAYTVSGNDITITISVTVDGTVQSQSKTITDATIAGMYAEYQELAANVNSAKSKLDALQTAGNDSMTWETIREPLALLVDPDKVTVNGISTGDLKNKISDLITDVTSGKGIRVQMPTGAGAYADIADFCGDYVADIELKDLTYGGVGPITTAAFMETKSTIIPPYLDSAKSQVDTAGSPSNESAADAIITDYYGYAVDLLFRTNAADSELQLQVEEAQRIYSDSSNTATQGAGSNMTFASVNPSFTSDSVKALMDAIRVVFMDNSQKILGVARLDVYQYDAGGNKLFEDADSDGVKDSEESYLYNTEDTGDGVKADLLLHEFSVSDDGILTIGAAKAANEQTLISLPQNTKVGITALVYLDGDIVTNAMVASAASSMEGSMNLQFSSTATLVPMNNAELRGTTSTTPEAAVTQ